MRLKGINANAKVLHLIKALNDKYYVAKTYDNGHYLVRNKDNIYYVVFKKDYFNSFRNWFKGMDKADKVDSLNLEVIKRADRFNATILIIHDESIYKSYPLQIEALCKKNGWKRSQNKENYYNKGNYTGNKEEKHEVTYSFPVEPIEVSVCERFEI